MNASLKVSLFLLLAAPLHAQTAPPQPRHCHMVCMDYDLFGHCIRKERICEDAWAAPRRVAAAVDQARKQAGGDPFQALGGLLKTVADDQKKHCHPECTLWFDDPTANPPKPPICVERTIVCD